MSLIGTFNNTIDVVCGRISLLVNQFVTPVLAVLSLILGIIGARAA